MSRRQSVFWQSGLPLIVLVCGGSFGLATLLRGKLRAEETTHKVVAIGKDHNGEEGNLDEALEELMKKTDLDSYANKPVPRTAEKE